MPAAMQRIQAVAEAPASGKPKVALDTCCVQYYISNPPVQPWADCLAPIFRAGLEGKVELYVSTVVVSELLAHVHFAHRGRSGYDAELDLLAILNRHFQVLDVNGDIARAAGRLRGNYVPGDRIALATPDALIGATSLANGHTLFVTNDAQLADALPDQSCVYLREAALDVLAQCFPAQCIDRAQVTPVRRGAGLPACVSLATLELGSVKPAPSATWQRLLSDAFTVASALNEPCIFFVLTEKKGRRLEATEVLFWHEGLATHRPVFRVIRRLYEHLGNSPQTGNAEHLRNSVWAFCFCSLDRERARQSHPGFASKTDHQRLADGWDCYLKPLWSFRSALSLPRTSFLICEDGAARLLNPSATLQFLDQARNVLGWGDGR